MAKINSTIFKQETIKSWFSGVGTSVNNEVIQPFQNANSVISKYNLAIQHNSLTQQGWQRLLSQSDDSLKAYLTSIKGSTASMAGYNVSLQGSITGFTKVSNAIKQYNALGAVSLKEQQAFATAVGATNAKLGSYLIGLNGSTAGLRGYGVSLVASTAKTIGLTVATTALNAAMTMGISVIVTGLISAFTAWINKSEEIAEKAQEAADKINSISESLKTNTETVENAKKRYAELAQEVENLGKITQSQGTLSNEEYEEFLDLSNQLAGIFPSLTKNYDENGNAILDLSGDVNTIVGSLDDLIQKEKELANQKIMEEFPGVFEGYAQDISDAESKVKSAQTEFDKINNAYQQLSNGSTAQAFDLQGNGWFTNENGEKVTLLMGEYIANLEALGLEYEKTQLKVKNQFGGDTISGYLVEATGDIDTAFTSKLETARENLQYAQQQLEGEKSSIDSYLNTWLQGEFSYVQIDDSGLQTAIQDMLFNFDFSNIPENKRGDWNYVSEYLRRNILFEINKVQDDPVISKAISEVFSNTELTPNEKANYLQQIQDYFGEDSSIVISLKPQIEETDTLQKQYDKAIEDTKAKFNGYDPTAFFKENSINTQEEVDKWLEIAQAANSAADAEERYVQGSTSDNKRTDLFDKLTKSKDSIDSFQSSVQSAYDAYSKLMDPNASPSDILDSVQSISEAVSEMGGSLNWEFIADYEDPTELLANAIDKVSKEYAESVLSGAGIDVDSEFGQMLANNIIQAQRLKAELDSYNTTTDSIQSAFKSLTSAVEEYNQHGYLTADTLQALLSLDSQYLACLINENGQLQINGQTYEALVQAKLADAEATAVQQAIDELGAVTVASKTDADVTSIGVIAEKAVALGVLSESYGGVAASAAAAAKAEALVAAYEQASSKNAEEADRIMANLDAKLQLIHDTANNTSGSFSNLTNHLNGFSSASGKASKATDELTEAMQSQKDALEAQKDALQKQVEHYEKVIDAINWFYDKQIEKQKKAIDGLEKQNDLLKEQQDNYDMALSAIDRFYQNQIDLIKTEQDAIDDRIVALREENDERKEQYELEQKQLALERARNQKTNLTYTADRGYIYTADEVSIKEAEDSLADAELNSAVSKLEKEKDKLQESINKLEEYRKLWGTVSDEYQNNLEDMQLQLLLGNDYESALLEGRLETVTIFKDNYIAIQSEINSNEELIASYEEKIEYYESLKEEWEDLTSKFEEETYIQLLIGEFGNNYENELLNGRTARWDRFANDYANIQSQLADVTDQIETLTQRMEEYAARMESAASRAISAANQAANVNVGGGASINGEYNVIASYTYNKGRAKGGIIGKDDESELDYIARSVGEDHMVALTEGEAVIPVDTVKANPGLVKGLLDADGIVLKPTDVLLSKHPNFDMSKFQNIATNIPWNVNVNPMIPNFERMSNNNTVEINIGDIHLSGVQDVNGLSNAIITKLPNRLLQDLGKK